MSIVIKDVLVNGKQTDILIEENIISEIGSVSSEAEHKIDGKGKAAFPSLMNAHTHAAMSLMRGYADDMDVMEWLQKKIWPLEAKLSEKEIYTGAKLACLEMIKSGTTFFNDMYWHYHGTARAAEEMGIRAAVSAVFIDMFDKQKAEEQIKLNKKLFEETKKYSRRIMFSLGPHAVYTVSEESLRWAKEFSDKNDVIIHMHVSESKHEVDECVKKHKKRPVEYLDDIGFLSGKLIACHAIWLNKNEIRLLKKHDVKIAHNPCSNMKLSSGILPYKEMRKAGLTIALGTDGCASNNNLDMFEEMKFAALLQKIESPIVMPAAEAFQMATAGCAKAFGLRCGEIAEGRLADIILVNLNDISLNPRHNLVSNIVYSANGSCVDSTICDGRIVMQGRKIAGEEEIVAEANEVARTFT